MRKTMFATASAFALMLGTAALADQTAAPGAAQTDPLATQHQAQSGADQTGATTLPGADAQQQAQTGTTGMPGASGDHGFGEGRSYSELSDDDREGLNFASDNGDFDADELMGATVVNDEGEEIGTIEDLVVSDDDSVERVVIKASGEAAGDQEQFFVVELRQLERGEGDSSDEFTLSGASAGSDAFLGQSTYEKQDGRWSPAPL